MRKRWNDISSRCRHALAVLHGRSLVVDGVDDMIHFDNMADVPDGSVIVEAFAVIKVLDPDGGIGFHTRQTGDLSDWEALGMLIAAADRLRKQLADNWEPD